MQISDLLDVLGDGQTMNKLELEDSIRKVILLILFGYVKRNPLDLGNLVGKEPHHGIGPALLGTIADV